MSHLPIEQLLIAIVAKNRGEISVDPRVSATQNSGIEYHAFEQDTVHHTQDLLAHGESFITSLKDYFTQIPDAKDRIALLEQEREKLHAFIFKQGKVQVKLTPPIILPLNINVGLTLKSFTSRERDAYIKAAVKQTESYLASMVQRLIVGIKTPTETNFEAMQHLKDIEIAYQFRMGHKAYISHLAIPKRTGILNQPLTIFSIKRPIDRLHQQGLTNIVESAWGHIDVTNQEFKVDGALLTGPWSPINTQDPFSHRMMGLHNLKQEFELLANKYFNALNETEQARCLINNSFENPSIIPLFHMTLLPLSGRLAFFNQEQRSSLAWDNHLLIGMITSEPFEITLTNGQKLYIKADINEMVMGDIHFAKEQQAQINVRGFNHWLDRIYEALQAKIAYLPDNEQIKELNSLIQQIKSKDPLRQQLEKAVQRLDRLYFKLKQIHESYEFIGPNKQDENRYNQLLNIIDETERNLYRMHQKLFIERKEIWQKNQVKRNNAIATLEREYAGINYNSQDMALRNFLEINIQINDAETLFYSKHYMSKNPDYKGVFQAKYAIINQLLNFNFHASCKHDNAQTVKLINHLMQMQMIKAVTGFYPGIHKSKNDKQPASLCHYLQQHIQWYNTKAMNINNATQEKPYFKEILLTKAIRTILPFVPPKANVISWQMWLEDLSHNIIDMFSNTDNSIYPKQLLNINRYQEVPTVQVFENELLKALNGKALMPEYQTRIKQLIHSLSQYHHFFINTEMTKIDSTIFWNKLVELSDQFGDCLLPLCNEEAILRVDSQQQEKYEQIHSVILVVEKIFYKITYLKKQLEKEAELFKKIDNIQNHNAYIKVFTPIKKDASFDDLIHQAQAKRIMQEAAEAASNAVEPK